MLAQTGGSPTHTDSESTDKIPWLGVLLSIQPRIRLLRSFDQSQHSYLGYWLRVQGILGGGNCQFLIGIGQGAQAKHSLRAGDEVKGESVPIPDPRLESAEFYKTSGLTVIARGEDSIEEPPPWLEAAPPLEIYRGRGHRRLDARTYGSKCRTCMWGCRMAVEMIIDQWKPLIRQYREETFCYGPKSCPFYRAGPTRKVPGRKGMSWEEEDWVDEEATAHRGPDD